jgi:UDP-N-acetylglucosamine acyltransferase
MSGGAATGHDRKAQPPKPAMLVQANGDTLNVLNFAPARQDNAMEMLLRLCVVAREQYPQVDRLSFAGAGVAAEIKAWLRDIKIEDQKRLRIKVCPANEEILISPKPYVHPKAEVDPTAKLGEFSLVGPFAVIGAGARIGDYTEVSPFSCLEPGATLGAHNSIGSHCTISACVTMGDGNVLSASVHVGGEPQQRGDRGSTGTVCIGHNNRIFDNVVIHRGTKGGVTRVGDDNLIFHGCHVAHDCTVGNRCTLINGVALGGHVTIGDCVYIAAGAHILPMMQVGAYANIWAGAGVTRHVPPCCIAATPKGERIAQLIGINSRGLLKLGIKACVIAELKRVFGDLLIRGGTAHEVYRATLHNPLALQLATSVGELNGGIARVHRKPRKDSGND